MMNERFKNIDLRTVYALANLVDYAEGRVESRTLAQNDVLSITVFSFPEGEGLSTHVAGGDALLYVMDGKAGITIGDDPQKAVSAGEMIIMPKGIPHSVDALEAFKMFLVVIQ